MTNHLRFVPIGEDNVGINVASDSATTAAPGAGGDADLPADRLRQALGLLRDRRQELTVEAAVSMRWKLEQ